MEEQVVEKTSESASGSDEQQGQLSYSEVVETSVNAKLDSVSDKTNQSFDLDEGENDKDTSPPNPQEVISKLKNRLNFYQRNNANLKKKLDEAESRIDDLSMKLRVEESIKNNLVDVVCSLRQKFKSFK